jgi:2-hydroxychromene-2-carboxylate isomerase
MAKVEFLFDFGSPNAYMSHKVIPDIEKRTAAKFEYVPILLGGVFKLTNNQPPMIAFGGVKNKPQYEQLEMRRFIEKHDLSKFKMNPNFPVNTLTIMRMAVAAQMQGQLPHYVDVVFGHMWENGKKMDDTDVIRAALIESGLDGDRLLEAAQTQPVKDQLAKNTSDAVARGAFGSPTFFVGDEIFFGKDRLRDVEEEIVKANVEA